MKPTILTAGGFEQPAYRRDLAEPAAHLALNLDVERDADAHGDQLEAKALFAEFLDALPSARFSLYRAEISAPDIILHLVKRADGTLLELEPIEGAPPAGLTGPIIKWLETRQVNGKAEWTSVAPGLGGNAEIDIFRPSVGMAAVKLLEDAGYRVVVPQVQVCCGQPAYNSGDTGSTREIAKQVIDAFEPYTYVVGPSGSYMATIIKDYPKLFADDTGWRTRAENLSRRTHELLSFLSDVAGFTPQDARCNGSATYHDSCSGLRSLGIKDQPRKLLSAVQGLDVKEMQDAETCCGFGGTFCVKYPAVSVKMADDKIANATGTGAQYLLGGDLGCLLNIAGRMSRQGQSTQVYHTAEVLAGMTASTPAIGKPE